MWASDETRLRAPHRDNRVLIRTLPLSNGNYGGILQAYALQQVLVQLGLSPATDLSDSRCYPPVLRSLARTVVRLLPWWVFTIRATEELRDDILNEETSHSLRPFIRDNINGVALYRRRGTIDSRVLADYGRLLVGSDQVWRHRYGDVKSYLFDFVDDPNIRMISYAASFGHDTLDGYNKQLIHTTRRLARRFHRVSVRETTAVEMCRTHWGLAATHHVDPTMLLPREHYQRLAQHGAPVSSPQCLTYILDDSPETQALVGHICRALRIPAAPLIHKPRSYAALRKDPGTFRKPSVETWLRAFADARYVITDSFHGTVFALLFNKPFLAISNRARGSARFESLLDMFGLRDRLVVHGTTDVRQTLDRQIDWRHIDDVLVAQRDRSIAYLREALLTD